MFFSPDKPSFVCNPMTAPTSCSMMLPGCYAAAVVLRTTCPVPYHCVICKTCVASLGSALQNASVLRTDSRFFEPLLFSFHSDHGITLVSLE